MLSVQLFASVSVFPHMCMCIGVTYIQFVSTWITAPLAVTPVNSEAEYTSICLSAQPKLTCMHDNLQFVREVARTSYLFCFIRQSAAATIVQVTRSLDSAWKFHNQKLTKMTLECLSHMFRPVLRPTQSSLQWVQLLFSEGKATGEWRGAPTPI